LVPRSGQGFLNWRYPWAWELPVVDWKLSLNPHVPLTLHIEEGLADVDLDFTKAHLTDFSLETGRSTIALRLPDNAGQTAVHVEAADTSVAIHVPVGVAAHIQVFKGQGSLEVDLTRFPVVEDGQEYRSSDYDTATNRVAIHLELGRSSVKII